MAQVPCPGCHALFPVVIGPVHPYVPSSPECWRTFGEIQAAELSRFGYRPAHRLVVDAYMAQHPGDGHDRRDRQSVFVHLAALCAALERSMPPDAVSRLLGQMVGSRAEFPLLDRSAGPGPLTVLDMLGTSGLDEYNARAQAWAEAVWASWGAHHPQIRAALDQLGGAPGGSSPR